MRVPQYGTPFALITTLALAACSGGDATEPGVDEGEGDRTSLEETTDDMVVTAGDFDRQQLGAKIEGPAGPEVNASFVMTNEDGNTISLGDIESYVACASNVSSCDPASLPEDNIYTYVHVVTPGVDEDNDEAFARPAEVATVTKAEAFVMTVPATGFTGEAGYSLEQARTASGTQASFLVKCEEDRLVFELATGEDWATGEPITFYWKSTVPPKGPGEGYRLVADGKEGLATGPVPREAPEGEQVGCS